MKIENANVVGLLLDRIIVRIAGRLDARLRE